MADKYLYMTIWVKNANSSIVKTCIPDNLTFRFGNWNWNVLKECNFFEVVLDVFGNYGWLIVSTSVPDENGVTRFIFSKKKV